MDANEFRQKIRAASLVLGERFGLMRTVSSLVSLKVDPAFNEVALVPESTYKDIYLRALSRSYYNFALDDYSLFQFSWSSETAWRLSYLPNPWVSGVPGAEEKVSEWEALEGMGLYDDTEIGMLISELPYHGSIPAFRFEYATDQYRELAHPAAHLHIGRHTQNRWPFSKVLNPLSFTLLILKMYYVDKWSERSRFFGGTDPCADMELIAELERSRRVHDFSETESKSIHFHAR